MATKLSELKKNLNSIPAGEDAEVRIMLILEDALVDKLNDAAAAGKSAVSLPIKDGISYDGGFEVHLLVKVGI